MSRVFLGVSYDVLCKILAGLGADIFRPGKCQLRGSYINEARRTWRTDAERCCRERLIVKTWR